MPTVSGCWNLMGVPALVCRDHGLEIVRCSLDVLAHPTARVSAFVVSPAHICFMVRYIVEGKHLIYLITYRRNGRDRTSDLDFL